MLTVLIGFPNEFIRESIGLGMNKQPAIHSASSFPYLERIAINRRQSQYRLIPNPW